MGLKDELETEVADVFRIAWTERDGQVVPDATSLKLGNDAVKLDGTVLYADMTGSTQLVDDCKPQFAAEVYKTYLVCAARIINAQGGIITAYDGDRIMAVFIGDTKNTSSAIAGLKINHAVLNIINPALARQYPTTTYRLQHTVGIDTSPLFVARIGVRNYNDLVWVGRAANYAAKLCAIKEPNTVFITKSVFERLMDNAKHSERKLMWKPRSWTGMNDMSIHSSAWTWPV